jgi:hypothetical protein
MTWLGGLFIVLATIQLVALISRVVDLLWHLNMDVVQPATEHQGIEMKEELPVQ